MIHLKICKNIVIVDKSQPGVSQFTKSWLTKFEDQTVMGSDFTNGKLTKRLQSVQVPRDLFTETGDLLFFARGILEWIPESEYIVDSITPEEVIMPTPTKEEIKTTLPSFELREDQITAVNKCLQCKRGVIQLPTATGKSAIIASTISWLLKFNPNIKILTISPTSSTAQGLNDTFLKNSLPSSLFNTQDQKLITPITASLVQTLCTTDNTELLKQVQAVFYDECLPKSARILLPNYQTKTIEQVYEDDSIQEVMSYNLVTNNYEVKPILRKIRQEYNDRFCRVYYFDQINKRTVGFTCTPNHKIHTKDRGYIPASELLVTDLIKIDYPNLRFTIFAPQLYMPVLQVSLNRGKIAKYKFNLEIADNHNYFADNVLVSNCHHLQCDTWNQLNMLLPNVEYSIGFSALAIDRKYIHETDFRNLDYIASLIAGSSGRILLHMDPSYYIQKGIIALPIVFRLHNEIIFPPKINESNWRDVVKYGLHSTQRTELIARTASFFSYFHRKTLILVSEKEYAHQLAQKLSADHPERKVGVSFGSGEGFIYSAGQKRKKDSIEVLNSMSTGDIDILLGTSHIDEGVDIAHLDVLILASGGKKDRRVIQRLGRVLRKSKTGKYAYIIDFTDQRSKVLSRHSLIRYEMYKDDIGIPVNNIYNNIEFKTMKQKFHELENN